MSLIEVQLHAFLTSPTDATEWSVSHPGSFTPGERLHNALLIEDWVSPNQCRACELWKTDKICVVLRIEPPSSDTQTRHYAKWATPTPTLTDVLAIRGIFRHKLCLPFSTDLPHFFMMLEHNVYQPLWAATHGLHLATPNVKKETWISIMNVEF